MPRAISHRALLRLERAAAAAGLGGVGIGEHKTAPIKPFEEIDDRAVEIERALLIDDQLHAVALERRVRLLVGLLFEIQRILETTASAPRNADAEHGVGIE